MINHWTHKYIPFCTGERIRIVFLFQAGTVWPSTESVYESCLEDERIDTRLVFVGETTVETSHMSNASEFLTENKLEYVGWEEFDIDGFRPHAVFIQFPYDAAFHTPETLSLMFVMRGIRVIYIPYGIEISDTESARKDHFNSLVVENSWRIYTCCEGIKEEYIKYCRNRRAVRAFGSPKFDAVVSKKRFPVSKDVKLRAGHRRLVVWKMHFAKKVSEDGAVKQVTPQLDEYLEFSGKLESFRDSFFVILPHPKMLREVVASDIQGDDSIVTKMRELLDALRNVPNAYIDESDDYRNSLYNADAIIMDRSAVMVEGAMCDVPLLFMHNEEFEEPLTPPVKELERSFYHGSNCGDIIRFLRMLENGEDPMRETRVKTVSRVFPYNDGKCGERIKEDMLLGITREKENKPRVVIYGTGEVCEYYMTGQKWERTGDFTIAAVSDGNESKWGSLYHGYRIIQPKEIRDLDYDVIVIMTEPHYYDIKKYLVYDLYLDERDICRVDEFVYYIKESLL